MAIQKKYIWIGVAALIAGIGIWAYNQYQRVMDYCLKFKGVKVHTIGMDGTVFDLILSFINKSDIRINIISQSYKVYLNGRLVSEVASNKNQSIEPNATSDIGVNVKFSPRSVLNAVNINEFLLGKQNINLKVDMNIRAGVGVITANIPYVYETSLKELMKGSGQNSSSQNPSKC